MNDNILEFEDLQRLTQKKTPGEVVARLDEMEIPFKRAGRGKPWTTIQQLNASFASGKPRHRKKTTPDKLVVTVK